ncbi:hypothetical protein SCHPADRAFT_980178 [Schizopora paradoxa]|uniref:Uncharacterized protein n=1 Tax=Schizopora paradoxa TaxID=27342 RepID=A0A0H2RC47_9AGAM|nr:hypothetical protein SCHPADRAFT_980178 [Schizopora paradoxa]
MSVVSHGRQATSPPHGIIRRRTISFTSPSNLISEGGISTAASPHSGRTVKKGKPGVKDGLGQLGEACPSTPISPTPQCGHGLPFVLDDVPLSHMDLEAPFSSTTTISQINMLLQSAAALALEDADIFSHSLPEHIDRTRRLVRTLEALIGGANHAEDHAVHKTQPPTTSTVDPPSTYAAALTATTKPSAVPNPRAPPPPSAARRCKGNSWRCPNEGLTSRRGSKVNIYKP